MKTILLILALISFTLEGSYAQSTKNCTCKKKAVHHYYRKMAAIHHHKAASKNIVSPKPEGEASTVQNCAAITPEPCHVYRKDNIVVMECPGIFYNNDNNGVFEYSTEGAYLGYYPLSHNSQASPGNNNTNTNNCVNENENAQIAPQHTTIDTYKGVAPASGNYCYRCTSH